MSFLFLAWSIYKCLLILYMLTLRLSACYQILQQMRSDTALLKKEEGGSPIRNPSTAAEDARLASLIALDGMLKQVKVGSCYHC